MHGGQHLEHFTHSCVMYVPVNPITSGVLTIFLKHNAEKGTSQEFYLWPTVAQAARNAIDIRSVSFISKLFPPDVVLLAIGCSTTSTQHFIKLV